jgi:hypothetical protein
MKDPGQKRKAYETPYEVMGQRQVPTNKTRRGKYKQYKQSTKRGVEGFQHWSGSRSTKSRYGIKGWQSGRTVGVGRGLSSSKGAGSRYKQKPQKHYKMGRH